MRSWPRPIVIAGVALLASACGASVPTPTTAGSPVGSPAASSSAASAAAPGITIGLLLPYTESAVNSDRGNAQKRAAELFLQKQGGMLGGQSATLVYEDESINGSLDLTKAQELVAQHASLVLGLIGDDGANAVRTYADTNKIPLIVTGASGDALTRATPGCTPACASPYVFRTSYSNWQLSEPLGEWAARHGAKSFYLVHSADTFGTESASAFAAGLGKGGGATTGTTAAQPGGDFSKFVMTIKAQPTKAVYAAFAGSDAAGFIGAWAKAGMTAAGYTLYGPGALTDDDILASVKDGAVGITSSMFWSSTLPGAENAALVQAYPQAYKDDAGNPAPATADVAAMWDTMKAVDAAVRTGGVGGDAFTRALAAETVSGVRGAFSFGAQTQNVVDDIYIRQVAASGGTVWNKVIDTVHQVADPGK